MITIHEGDLLSSQCDVICHQTNCVGLMGSGIAKAIRAEYPEAYDALSKRYDSHRGAATLGECDFVPVVRDNNIKYVVNCYGQYSCYPRNQVHTNYAALQNCFDLIKEKFAGTGYIIGFPYKIGCGLAGGDWDIVYSMIEKNFAGDEWRIEIWRLT